jgi:hypothetical protein
MLDKRTEQRVNIRFLVTQKKPADETLNLLRKACGVTPYEEILCLNGTRGLQKEEVMRKINDLAVR